MRPSRTSKYIEEAALSRAPRGEGWRLDGERAGPDDPRRDGVPRDEVVDDVEALLAQQLPPLLEGRKHLSTVALASARAEEVGALDEAHLRVEQLANVRGVGGGVGDQRQVALDDCGRVHGGFFPPLLDRRRAPGRPVALILGPDQSADRVATSSVFASGATSMTFERMSSRWRRTSPSPTPAGA
jgi:hypothetical protein